MLDCNINNLFDALETMSLIDDCEFEKIDSNLKIMVIF